MRIRLITTMVGLIFTTSEVLLTTFPAYSQILPQTNNTKLLAQATFPITGTREDTLLSNPYMKTSITIFKNGRIDRNTKKVLTTQAAPAIQQTIIYVNSQSGTDNSSAGKSESSPYRTISYALQQAIPGTTIQLASGKYSNETFPLVIKPSVTLKGNESGQGQGVEIVGGDFHMSRAFGRQNVTIVAQENTQISGVTVTNPNSRGTGVWVESGEAIIRKNSFINSKREGVFVTGNAAPRIENNRFANNDANGISVTKQARGEIRNNIFDNTGFGIAIGGNSAPLVSDNQIRGNRNGIVLTDSAQPKLQSNSIENNREYGLVIIGEARPFLDRNNFTSNQKQDQLRVIPLPQEAPPEEATSE